MPLYQYKCPDCGYTKEYIMPIAGADDEEDYCEECTIAAAERGDDDTYEPPLMVRQMGTIASIQMGPM